MNQPSLVPFGALLLGVCSLCFLCGMALQGRLDKERQAHERIEPKATTPVAKPDRWYACDRIEVDRTCRALQRSERTKKV